MAGQVLLVSSSGGVLLDLLGLEPWWRQYRVQWWAVDAPDTREALANARVHWSRDRHAADVRGLAYDLWSAWRLMRKDQPIAVVSAGTRIAIPVFIAAWIDRRPCFWVETLNVIERPGWSARLCARLSKTVVVQHPHLLDMHRSAVLVGNLY